MHLPWQKQSKEQEETEESSNLGQENEKQESGDSEGGDREKQGGPPQAVGFWDSRLRHVRNEAFLKWTITTAFLMAFILGCMSIYWAVLFKVNENLGTLVVYVVDMDGQVAPYDNIGVDPLVGPQMTQLARQMLSSNQQTLGWGPLDAEAFDNDPNNVKQSIYDEEAWAAIIINPNATALLYDAVQNGNTDYDPMGACQLVYVQARQDTAWASYLAPPIRSFQTQATAQIGQMWTDMVMQNATGNQTLLQNVAQVPQALSPAIGFSEFNLRPFTPPQATPATSIGLIYLIIISFFSFSFYLPIHMKYLKPEGHPPLKFWQLIFWRWCATISAYFMLSLAYSFISLAFQISFYSDGYSLADTEVARTYGDYSNPAKFGDGTFPVYWMVNFFGMIALGLACENATMLCGQPWTALWLIFWVITNVSTSFYEISLAPDFYRWGYAWPLHYVVEASRTVLFDLHSDLGLDFGVLIAWGAVNTLLFPFCCYFMRWRSQNGVVMYYR
ncbi:hypothetical protein MBLNU230_g1726t1 [Neophaeotheca triangularis]